MKFVVNAAYAPIEDLCGMARACDEAGFDSIAISDQIGATEMACASDELAEQSQQYYAALAAATTWSVGVSGRLELRDDGGALQVSYAPAGE